MLKKVAITVFLLIIFLVLAGWYLSGHALSIPGLIPKTSLYDPPAHIVGDRSGERSTTTTRALLPGTPQETLLYIIKSPVEGPVLLVIGGVHGNEPAGYLAAERIATWEIDRGTLLVIPRAHVQAIAAGTRTYYYTGDLNRSFPGNPRGNTAERLAAAIYGVMEEFKPAWVIDLHEAREFERNYPGALGQTLIYPGSSASMDIAENLLSLLNSSLMEEQHHFILRRGCIAGGTTAAAVSLGLDGFIVETCEKLDLEVRISHHLTAVHILLYLVGINVY